MNQLGLSFELVLEYRPQQVQSLDDASICQGVVNGLGIAFGDDQSPLAQNFKMS
jgi:hypothetical protein